ncbi:MAG: hypothetical protein Ct9H300mP6_03150 [Gammaproteobacteria bacterium]|nr:MAG: hypothetical protein Ct9H300mP6_03150 [Gammaproteobacteria bacterium]
MNRTTTLKSHYYYDEAIFAKEIECIFKKNGYGSLDLSNYLNKVILLQLM